jgi:hypothetical protein
MYCPRHHSSLLNRVHIILLGYPACIWGVAMPGIYFNNEVGYDENLNINDVDQMSPMGSIEPLEQDI